MRRAAAFATALLLAGGIVAAGASLAQVAPDLGARRQQLLAAKQHAAEAARRADALEAQAAQETDAAAAARRQQAAVAARVERAQADIAAAGARVALVDGLIRQQRATLAAERTPIARLLAALASFARRPPIVGLLQPGSIDDSVHVRAVLGTVTPAIERRTASLRAEVERTAALRADAALAARALADSRRDLEQQQLALARLEAQHQARATGYSRDALHQSDRAIALGERARDIVDLMELGETHAATQGELQTLAGPDERPAAMGGAGGGFPGWSIDAAPYRLPVDGHVVTGLGELSDAGVSARGLTFATAAGAPVTAPAAGRVAYARPFRDYGPIIILDHGGGWTTLVTGLSSLSVEPGRQVAQGARIGTAAMAEDPRVTVELRRRGRPVDITALIG